MNLFAFIGNDEISQQDALDRSLEQWLGKMYADPHSRETHYGSEIKLDTLEPAYSNTSMFSSKRAIILKQIEKVPLSIQNTLTDVLKHPDQDVGVFILGEKWDGRSGLKKLFNKTGSISEHKLPYSNQIPKWITDRAQSKYQRTLSLDNAFRLWECVGDSLGELENELQKLDVYLPKGDSITAESIEELIASKRDRSLFEFHRHMGLRQKSSALLSLQALLLQGDPPFLISLRLYNYFLKLLKIRTYLEQGVPANDIPKKVQVNPFIFKKEQYIQQANSRSIVLWKKILVRLAKLEQEFKQGKYTERFEVEFAFFALL